MKDSVGNEIHDGAILKVFHFVGARGRKHFMYKKVLGKVKKGEFEHFEINHLEGGGSYFIPSNREILEDCVVVQCTCEYHIYNNLKINRKFGA